MNILFEELKKIKSIADIGLLYAKNDYDIERYRELQEIFFNVMKHLSGHSAEALQVAFPVREDYPTAKVDIRGLLLRENKILLVKESADNRWSLPGGWADIGLSPKETVVKEFKEETGLDVVPQTLLAVFDKRLHPHPPQAAYVYKMIFHCEPLSDKISKGFDVLDVQFFSPDELPPLSEDRILESQIDLVMERVRSGKVSAYFD
jgi:ADP-ribose pyrophosphatase YjhB (NUDIX family)